MPNPPFIHTRNGRSLDLATYIMLAIQIVVSLILFPEPARVAAVIGLCIVFGLVSWVGSRVVTTQRTQAAVLAWRQGITGREG